MKDKLVYTTATIHNITKTPYGLRWALDVERNSDTEWHPKYSHFFNSDTGWRYFIEETAKIDVTIAEDADRLETAQRVRKLCKGWKIVVAIRQNWGEKTDILFIRRDYSVGDWGD